MYISRATAERIKFIAKSKNMVVKNMLEDCGLNKNTISTMISRGSWLQANSLAKIADYLDCSVDYLLGRTDNPEVNRSAEKHTLAEYSEIAALGGSMTRDALVDDDDFDTTLPEK